MPKIPENVQDKRFAFPKERSSVMSLVIQMLYWMFEQVLNESLLPMMMKMVDWDFSVLKLIQSIRMP